MKVQPTYDDANLILRLYDLRREEKLRAARKWFANAPQFTSRDQWLQHCKPGSEENAYFRMVTSYWDMAASFVVNGILNAELFYRANNQELVFVWVKVEKIAAEMRDVNKNPLYWANLEQVARGFLDYMNEHAPGAVEQFAANVARTGQPAAR